MIRHDVVICPLIGTYRDHKGTLQKVVWKDIEVLHLDGQEIAKIKTTPGAPIGILNGFALTDSEKQAVSEAVAAARGGVPPSAIHCPSLMYDFVNDDDDEGEETDVDDE